MVQNLLLLLSLNSLYYSWEVHGTNYYGHILDIRIHPESCDYHIVNRLYKVLQTESDSGERGGGEERIRWKRETASKSCRKQANLQIFSSFNSWGGGKSHYNGDKWLPDTSLLFYLGWVFVCFSRLSKKLFRDTTKCFDWVIESQAKHFLL